MDIEKIGVKEKFTSMGGNSLNIMALISRIKREFEVNITLSDILRENTIETISSCIKSSKKEAYLSIRQGEEKNYYPLSFAQRPLYFLYKFDKTSLAYNVPQVVKLEGNLDKEKLNNAFNKLIIRHESLRTAFEVINNEPVQKISDQVNFEIEYFHSSEEGVESIVTKFIKPFDLSKAPLIRAGIIETSALEHILMVDMHHIITDGTSHGLLIKDFMALYDNEELPALRLQYKDYAEWQRGSEQQSKIAKQKDFWINKYSDELNILELPTDFLRPSIKSFEGSATFFEINAEETKALKSFSEQEGTTLYMVLLSIFNIFISKLCNQEDIVIGTPVAGRHHVDFENMIGMFVNTLALRNYPKAELSFKEFLLDVKTTTSAYFDNQTYQYEDLIDNLKIKRDKSRNPLFETMLVFQNFESKVLSIPGLTLKPYDNVHKVSKFDSTLSATEYGGLLFLNFEYSTKLFKKETIERFVGYFKKIVSIIVNDKNKKISEIEIITDTEKHQLLHKFNDTEAKYPKNKTVIELFEEQVEKVPNNIALVFGEENISYEQLNNKANAIARQINGTITEGVNNKICLLFNPSTEMIASILGILKSGCSYVSLSPNVPENRNKHIFIDCEAKALLVQEGLLKVDPNIASFAKESQLILIKEGEYILKQTENQSNKTSAEDPIYVIYTSGTTGNPKGVEVKNLGILNMLSFYKHLFKVKKGMKMSHVANIIFDASAFEIWPSLIHGGCLYIAPDHIRHDPELMRSWLIENKIEITFQPTAIAEYLLRKQWNINESSLKIINVAGDRFNYFPEEKIPFKLYNLYGPTEDSIWSTWTELKYNKSSINYSIGKPISNKKIFIINKHNKLQPLKVPGELCISGDGLAKGYLNKAKQTEEKFVDNPFMPGERMYKTGDLARWLPDGNIEFLGRIDYQVKIRGFRVELGEIENQLLEHERVNEAVVLAKGKEGGDKQLIAYYVSEIEISVSELRSFLFERLPDYMIPTYYIHLESLPYTSNGKMDRKALPVPELKAIEESAKPINQMQRELVKMWADILGIEEDKIGVNVNFFEMGGNSIRLITLVDQINRHFKVNLTAAKLFQYPEIALLSEYLKNLNELGSDTMETETEDGLEQLKEKLKFIKSNNN